MGSNQYNLGQFEEILLLAIIRLRTNAYGVSIQKTVDEVGGRTTSLGAIYTTLDRLEQKGYVSSYEGEATPQRGGRAKRYFKVEAPGFRALREADSTRSQLMQGVDLGLQPQGGAA